MPHAAAALEACLPLTAGQAEAPAGLVTVAVVVIGIEVSRTLPHDATGLEALAAVGHAVAPAGAATWPGSLVSLASAAPPQTAVGDDVFPVLVAQVGLPAGAAAEVAGAAAPSMVNPRALTPTAASVARHLLALLLPSAIASLLSFHRS